MSYIPGCISLLLGSKACIYISCSGNTTENSRPVLELAVSLVIFDGLESIKVITYY